MYAGSLLAELRPITSHSNEECSPPCTRSRPEGLVKTYPGPGKTRIRALDGLTLSVARGTIFAVVGPNGAGKTTTVKILTTLATPDEGTATVEGIDVRTSPAQARRVIGVVAQRSGADPGATGRENLVLQGHLYGMSTGAAKARAAELLERFRLTDAAGRFVRTYSGGMQRRLDVALGLMHRPAVLFLDEPTTGLDPESRAAMWDEITALAAVDQVTVLLTTHYLDEADRLAGRLAIVDRGRVVAEGDPEELKRDLEHRLPGRGVPALRGTPVQRRDPGDGGSGTMTTTTVNPARVGLAPAPAVLSDTWYLTGRKLRALVRQPFVLVFSVAQPAIWLFLFGELFHKVIDIPGFGYQGSFLAYLIPGVVAMNAMSGNMWAGMAMIEEIDRGTLNRFLVTPASRLAIMNASVVEQAVGTTIQTLIIVVLGYAGRSPLPGRRGRHRGADRGGDPGGRLLGRPVQHDGHAAALP